MPGSAARAFTPFDFQAVKSIFAPLLNISEKQGAGIMKKILRLIYFQTVATAWKNLINLNQPQL